MDPVTIGIIGVAVLIIIFLLGMPVAYTMAFVGVIGFCAVKGLDAGLGLLARDFWDTWSKYDLTVIPMFVFMGSVAFYAGMSGRLYDAAYTIFGRWRGGLAIATVVATAGFSAICGSTSATAAAMGKVAIPEMRRHGYDPGLACGCMAAAGSLGIMIPPSTIFIIYGILAEQSIGKLFVAGVIPGLILAVLFCVAVYAGPCSTRPRPRPAARTTLRQKLMGMTGLLEMSGSFRPGSRRPVRGALQSDPGCGRGHGRGHRDRSRQKAARSAEVLAIDQGHPAHIGHDHDHRGGRYGVWALHGRHRDTGSRRRLPRWSPGPAERSHDTDTRRCI